jgi:DNA-binding MarR family transcriptional regulator
MDASGSDSAYRLVDQWVFAWCSLIQRSRCWQAHLDDALRPHQLVAAEFLVLWRTGHASPPGISQVELARELNVSAAQVCGIVETLRERAWLQVARPPEDRRRLHCSLTPCGVAALERISSELLPMADRCLREAPPTWSESLPQISFQEEAA